VTGATEKKRPLQKRYGKKKCVKHFREFRRFLCVRGGVGRQKGLSNRARGGWYKLPKRRVGGGSGFAKEKKKKTPSAGNLVISEGGKHDDELGRNRVNL